MTERLSLILVAAALGVAAVASAQAQSVAESPSDGVLLEPYHDGRAAAPAPQAGNGAASLPSDGEGLAAALFAAIRGGQWYAALGVALVILVGGLRRYGRILFPFLGTRTGGYTLAFATAAVVVVATAIAAGEPVGLGTLGTAFAAAFAAIGVHTAARDSQRPMIEDR